MVLLARTTPIEAVQKRTDGLSVFLVDLREARRHLTITPIRTMTNHATTRMVIDGLPLGPEALIGVEGKGFRCVLDGMNAERILIAGECVGDGRFLTARATERVSERVVFGRPIGANQAVQFPIARAYMALEAADLMRWKATALYERGEPCGAEANMAKFLASEASWAAANACLDAFGGAGFATDLDVERKFRETRLSSLAPVGNNLIQAFVGRHVLGMPRTY
jgi:acyl-CoA dehydrogenase